MEIWKQRMLAYEDCLSATSIRTAPWYVVPADDKENARLIIAKIIVDTLKKLKMSYPETDVDRRQEWLAIRQNWSMRPRAEPDDYLIRKLP
jgi:hypothetical protein